MQKKSVSFKFYSFVLSNIAKHFHCIQMTLYSLHAYIWLLNGWLTTEENLVFKCGPEGPLWGLKSLLHLSSDSTDRTYLGPFKLRYFQHGVKHALWTLEHKSITSYNNSELDDWVWLGLQAQRCLLIWDKLKRGQLE